MLSHVQPGWDLGPLDEGRATAEERAVVDRLFNDDWQDQYWDGLHQLAKEKSQGKFAPPESYNFRAELGTFWRTHRLGSTQYKQEWLKIVNGDVPLIDSGCGVDNVFQFILRHGMLHSHTNYGCEAQMRRISVYGDAQLDGLANEMKLLLNDWVLQHDRIARRQPQMRQLDGLHAGKQLEKDMGNKQQATSFLNQLLSTAHGFDRSECEGALQRAAKEKLARHEQVKQERLEQMHSAEHVVEQILGHRVCPVSGELEFECQWKDYSDAKHNSYETAEAIAVGVPDPWARKVRVANRTALRLYLSRTELSDVEDGLPSSESEGESDDDASEDDSAAGSESTEHLTRKERKFLEEAALCSNSEAGDSDDIESSSEEEEEA